MSQVRNYEMGSCGDSECCFPPFTVFDSVRDGSVLDTDTSDDLRYWVGRSLLILLVPSSSGFLECLFRSSSG